MSIGYGYMALIAAGIAGIVWGFPAAHRLKKPYDSAAALLVLCSIVACAFGILLTCIPGFFR